MLQQFVPGDFLIFQLESGYGLLRVLEIEGNPENPVWHLAAFEDLFLDIDMADMALQNPERLSLAAPHLALTNRAFESTQVAKMMNSPVSDEERSRISDWQKSENPEVSDRSIRLMLGLR